MPRTALDKTFGLEFNEHKLSVIDPASAKDCLQVIGAGLPRCGTTSLKAALEILGFDPCHHMVVRGPTPPDPLPTLCNFTPSGNFSQH